MRKQTLVGKKLQEWKQIRKSVKWEKSEQKNLVRDLAYHRMSSMLSFLYPGMSVAKREEIARKFSKKTGIEATILRAAPPLFFAGLSTHWIKQIPHDVWPYNAADLALMGACLGAAAFSVNMNWGKKASYNKLFKKVSVTPAMLKDKSDLAYALDHEAIHFLNKELKLKRPSSLEEPLAYGISPSFTPDDTTKMALKKIKNFPASPISFSLSSKRFGETLSRAKSLSEMPLLARRKMLKNSADLMIVTMSNLVSDNAGLEARNRFLRQTLEGHNPVLSFNSLMKDKGIRAVVEGKTLKIKQVKP